MLKLRRLTTLWASTACFRVSFTFINKKEETGRRKEEKKKGG
jgi:hypothetical protein